MHLYTNTLKKNNNIERPVADICPYFKKEHALTLSEVTEYRLKL